MPRRKKDGHTYEPEYVSVAGYAEIFDIDPRTVRRHIAAGFIKAIDLDGIVRIPLSEVERKKKSIK